MRGGWCGCASRAMCATSPWNTLRDIATRWGLRCRRDWRRFFWSRGRSRWRRSFGDMRGLTGRSLRPILRRDIGCRWLSLNRSCMRCMDGGDCWRENSVPADITASGAIRKYCSRSGERAWRGCGGRLSPSNSTCSRGSPHGGRGSRCRGAASTRCWMRSRGCRGRPFQHPSLEREVLPARIAEYRAGDLDTLMSAGEVIWVGVEPIGERDGRIALYLAQSLPLLLPPGGSESGATAAAGAGAAVSERAQKIVAVLEQQGASFFAAIHAACGGGFPGETRDALWELVWSGRVTNDTLHPVRNLRASRESHGKQSRVEFEDERPGSPEFLRRMRLRTPGRNLTDGRWSLVTQRIALRAGETAITTTQWSANIAQQLLLRYGIIMRETAVAENVPGGFPTIYAALKTMEDSGWIRRGMFVAGMGAAQFAMPAGVDLLRTLRLEPAKAEVVYLAATDPANPYGVLLPWPRVDAEGTVERGAQAPLPMMARAAGAGVILINGELAAFMRRRNPALRVFLPEAEPERGQFAHELAKKLAEIAIRRQTRRQGLSIGAIDGAPAREHFLAPFLEDAGFVNTTLGLQMRHVTPIAAPFDGESESEPGGDQDARGISESA